MHTRHKGFLTACALVFIYLLGTSAAFAGSTTLSWHPPTVNEDGTPLTDLAGYKIYYGTVSRSYSQSIDVGNNTMKTVSGLSEGATYYFAVTAYNTSQKESKYSNEIGRTITGPNPPQPPPPSTNLLTVSKSGTGSGSVNSSPAGISCGSDCSEIYLAAASVTLSASPDPGSFFTGWSGACTGTGSCTVTMETAKSVTAKFIIKTYTIKASAGKGGSIAPSGAVAVTHGSTQVFSITADVGYSIAKIIVDDTPAGTAGTYTFSSVAAGHTIRAYFLNMSDGTIADSYFSFLPATGQTESSASGDDGDIRAGIEWPEPRFINHKDGTVTDTLTGLMWLRDGGCLKRKKWSDAVDAIARLNSNPGTYSCTGYSAQYADWRMPNIKEMNSLLHYGETDTTAWLNSTGFSNMQKSWYWSSTTHSGAIQARMLHLAHGIETSSRKSKKNYTMAVRSTTQGSPYEIPVTGQTESFAFGDDGDIVPGTAWPEPRFVDNGDGTITDSLTGLMWMKDWGCLHKENWSGALITITEMNENPGRYNCLEYSAHYTDWRLPNIVELDSLMHYGETDTSAWLDRMGFRNMSNSWHWSSTSKAGKEKTAYGVHMKKVRRAVSHKKKKFSTVPVRGMAVSETE
ncbi:MAG: DUF1566 domain-containing protein [Nitrospirota bacterium]